MAPILELEPPAAAREAPRAGWKAGLSSLLLPGLGHVYVGRPKRGAAFFAALAIPFWCLALVALSGRLTVAAFWSIQVVRIGAAIWAIVDAVRIARGLQGRYRLRDYNRWYGYAAIF